MFADVVVYSQTVMTTDILGRSASFEGMRHITTSMPGPVSPATADCDEAVQMINQAERIAIPAGIGCAGARDELIAFAEVLQAPIVRTLKAKEVIDDNHPLCIGGLGLLGGRPAVRAMDQCDLLIMVGSEFPYHDFFPHGVRSIQIDIQPTQIGKRHPIDIGLAGHAKPTLAKLAGRVDAKRSGVFLESMQPVA